MFQKMITRVVLITGPQLILLLSSYLLVNWYCSLGLKLTRKGMLSTRKFSRSRIWTVLRSLFLGVTVDPFWFHKNGYFTWITKIFKLCSQFAIWSVYYFFLYSWACKLYSKCQKSTLHFVDLHKNKWSISALLCVVSLLPVFCSCTRIALFFCRKVTTYPTTLSFYLNS